MVDFLNPINILKTHQEKIEEYWLVITISATYFCKVLHPAPTKGKM